MDFNQAGMLLTVCNLAKDWPNLKKIHDAAMAELLDLNNEANDHLVERATAKAEKDKADQAKRAKEIEDRAKADEAARAKVAKPVPQPVEDKSLQQQTTDGRRSENVPVERKV